MAGGAVEPSRVVEALELLLGRPAGPGPDGVPLRLEALRDNAAALEERLRGEPGWAALRGLRAAVLGRAPALAAGAEDEAEPAWAVACAVLALLLCLKERLEALSAAPVAPASAPGAAPPPAADTLSAAQGQAVRRALRAAVGLGLAPYLPPGVGRRPGLPAPPLSPGAARGARLRAATAALVELARHPALGAPLLAQHLGPLLAGLCLLGHGPAVHCEGLSEAERAESREALQHILDRVYQPLAVRELLILQGGPKQSRPAGEETKPAFARSPAWLRRLCGQLLSERLMRPNGLQAVVRGIMEGTGGGTDAETAAVDWRKCDAVAKILASCPQQCLSLEDYYKHVCPQILDLLHIQDKLTARQFQRVATTTLLTMVKEHPQLAEKHLLQPLLTPLLRCSDAAEIAEEDLSAGTVLVTEAELSSCVEDVFKVYVVGNDSSSLLLRSLQSVLGVVFSLYSFAKQNVSYLRDEDEALYQKVSSEQCHVESLVELLSHCQQSGLAGDFFIHCLKALRNVAAEDEAVASCDAMAGRSLLELEQHSAEQRRKLLVLQLVAALCESVSDTVFTNIAQVEEFVAVTLQRACISLARGHGTAVEAQTLSMAMGLVAAVLSGAMQLKSSDFAVLKRLLPLLEEVSCTHPDPVIQELAADLRITICTRGAFSTEMVGTAAESVLGKKLGPGRTEACTAPCQSPGAAGALPQHSHSCGHPSAPRESEEQTVHGEPSAVGPAAAPSAESSAPAQLHELLLSAYDPQVPVRAAALRSLSSLIMQRDPEALQIQEKILQVFLENLQHEDSFVYLSAIQGAALLSSEYPEQMLPILLARYGHPVQGTEDSTAAVTRMKLGEVLMRVTRALGDLVIKHREPLIHAFLRGARNPDSTLRASSLSNLGELCQRLGFQLGSVIHEVSSCLTAIAKTDPEAEVRRAAVHVVVLLLRGLSKKATEKERAEEHTGRGKSSSRSACSHLGAHQSLVHYSASPPWGTSGLGTLIAPPIAGPKLGAVRTQACGAVMFLCHSLDVLHLPLTAPPEPMSACLSKPTASEPLPGAAYGCLVPVSMSLCSTTEE
ncbi:transport and Golgi organization protein 6 homolog isoform X3 [Tympanuchus pallidicinctus]|uniref:transport and Golgi organization protein 6 homolog isoform X3 n=1 Tax=Tympanuchus pallidicinctus TaxID=109042 RepID=UPI002287058F|nr:transport and Golgi organization protein 6 homolog isoform X3 [Tympanuchus pallidicinctus]